MWLRGDARRNAQDCCHWEPVGGEKFIDRGDEWRNLDFVEKQLILQIRVPRAVGTCTRCPMEVVLSKVDGVAWTCQISLRFTHDANGVKLPGEPKILSFGDTMTDFRAVEERLKRAQSALLQLPLASDDDVTPFLADDYVPPINPQVDFSRNVVRLDVSGKDLVNVTFIDLPGIISNAAEV